MQIESGLFDHMVLQRTFENVSHAAITGTADHAGTVVAFVTGAEGEPLDAFLNEPIGEVQDGRFHAVLKGLPCGGPYEIQLSLSSRTGKQLETLVIKDVLVGDVWLLAGQSNMQGIGLLSARAKPHPDVRAFYMDDRWDVAEEALHNIPAAVDPVHAQLCGGVLPPPQDITGVGPGHVFGLTMQYARSIPQGLIACAHGGTSMTQWNPSTPDDGGQSLYGALMRRFRKNGSLIAGMIWYQGESDANDSAVSHYTERMVGFVKALRRDTHHAELPVVIVQLSRVLGWPEGGAIFWNSIQEQQRRLPDLLPRLATVPAIDLTLDDGIHVSGRGMKRLGRRLGEAMQALNGLHNHRPMELAKVDVRSDERGLAEVVITYDHVVGHLRSGSRPWGFTIGKDSPKDLIIDVRLSSNQAIIRTCLSPLDATMEYISYGKGTNPYCNIVDEADRSLPVFGPLPMGTPHALTDAVRSFKVSPVLPGAGTLETLAKPDPETIAWEPRTFTTPFANRHAELELVGQEDGLVYYALSLDCPEGMPVTMLFGYDGPVKVWLNELEIYADPEGTNPATPTKAFINLQLPKARHELLIALGANKGRAWGVYVRFMRRDVDPRVVIAGNAVLPLLGV